MDAADIDHNFEPQIRARSNTWPLRPNRELEPQSGGSPASEDSNPADGQVKEKGDPLGLTAKKSGSRRNAWGNLSYADLITKAIQSSPEKRLTLSQIYDWMVQNVPYFKDKGDSTSSAGWKNSIRHNLSLHSRFMRIQNEGTGKSSWWVINPDAKPGKAPRRRAGSMETKNYDKKRGRIRKKIGELRAAQENGGSPLGSEDYLDSLGFGDFRPRTSSNASSCGRLSPIQAGVEPDLHDSQVPPMSPIPWGAEAEVDGSQGMYTGGENFSELVDSLVGGMKITGQQDTIEMPNGLTSDAYLSNGVGQDYGQPTNSFLGVNDSLGDGGQYSHLPAPPPYPDRSPNAPSPQQPTQLSPLESVSMSRGSYPNLHSSINSAFSQPTPDMYTEPVLDHMNSPAQLSVSTPPQPISTPDRSQQNSPNPQAFATRLSPQTHRANGPQGMRSPLNCSLSPQQTRALLGSPPQRSSPVPALQQQQAAALQLNASILRNALTRSPLVYGQPTTTTQFTMGLSPTSPSTATSSNINATLSPHHHITQQQLQQQQMRISPSNSNGFLGEALTGSTGGCGLVANGNLTNGNNNNVPLDIDMESLMSVDYDMDQVIKQELSLEGNLDCNFDNVINAPTSAAASQNFVH